VLLPDYLGLRLTGQRRLDLANAASTGMVDQNAADWWPEALAAVGVPAQWVSPIGRPGEVIGALRSEAAEELGLSQGIPVALGSNDQLNGAVGVGNVKAGIASGTVGTAMAIVSTVEVIGVGAQRSVTWGRHPVPGLFFLLAYAKTSGILLTWLRDLAAPQSTYEDLLAEAERVPPGSDGLVCLPHFSGTATPTFRSEVRGGFVGFTLGHSRAHMVRAVAEAVCFECRDALSLAARVARPLGPPSRSAAADLGTGQPIASLRMLGGATRSNFWMQMLADVVRLPLEVPECGEAPVLGGAVFAGVGAGRFASISEGAAAFYRPGRSFAPRVDAASPYDPAYAAYRQAMERLYPGALGSPGGTPKGGSASEEDTP
jgi:sugar (pentulose or hexulose) kinase